MATPTVPTAVAVSDVLVTEASEWMLTTPVPDVETRLTVPEAVIEPLPPTE